MDGKPKEVKIPIELFYAICGYFADTRPPIDADPIEYLAIRDLLEDKLNRIAAHNSYVPIAERQRQADVTMKPPK